MASRTSPVAAPALAGQAAGCGRFDRPAAGARNQTLTPGEFLEIYVYTATRPT